MASSAALKHLVAKYGISYCVSAADFCHFCEARVKREAPVEQGSSPLVGGTAVSL